MDRTGSILIRVDYRIRDNSGPVHPADAADIVQWELCVLEGSDAQDEVPQPDPSSIIITGITLTGVACLSCGAVTAPLPGAVCPGCGVQQIG